MKLNTQRTNPFIRNDFGFIPEFTMTPTRAAFLLGSYNNKNVRNVDINEARKRIAPDIQAGRWDAKTAETLKFEKTTGEILDGATRLQGIVFANKPVKVSIAHGVPSSAALYLDTSRRRSMGVSFAAYLGKSRNEAGRLNKVAAIARQWKLFTDKWQPMRYSRKDLLDFSQENMKHIETMMEKRPEAIANRAGFQAACAFYHSKNPDKAQKLFLDVTGDGAGLAPNSPALLLRNYLMRSKKTHPMERLTSDFQHALFACHLVETSEKSSTLARLDTWV